MQITFQLNKNPIENLSKIVKDLFCIIVNQGIYNKWYKQLDSHSTHCLIIVVKLNVHCIFAFKSHPFGCRHPIVGPSSNLSYGKLANYHKVKWMPNWLPTAIYIRKYNVFWGCLSILRKFSLYLVMRHLKSCECISLILEVLTPLSTIGEINCYLLNIRRGKLP